MRRATAGRIISLQCSEALAVALGCEPIPLVMDEFVRRYGTGIKAGTTISVLTPMGAVFMWPVRGAA